MKNNNSKLNINTINKNNENSENTNDINNVSDINVELVEWINWLITQCNNNTNAVKIKRINDYINTTYPEIQDDFEKRFPKTYSLNKFKNHINILQEIITNVLHKKINTEMFYNLSVEETNLGIQFINVIYQYLLNSTDLNETKNKIFLTAHEIDSKNFSNLNQSGILSLCEMSEKGIDVSVYANSGNLKVNFLNDVANGKFKSNQDELLKRQKIIDTIESCLKDDYIEEIEYNDHFSLIFEPSANGLAVFTNLDLDNSIAQINQNGEFIEGSLNIILITIYKNTENKNEEAAKTANTIDNIILKYNETLNEQQLSQLDLATALRLALELSQSDTNTDNSSN